MTQGYRYMPHNDDMTEGFLELLDTCGVSLRWENILSRAIFSAQSPASAPYALTPGDDQDVRIAALASVFSQSLPAIGDYFEDDNDTRYRIKSRIQRPGQPIIRFTCEVSEL